MAQTASLESWNFEVSHTQRCDLRQPSLPIHLDALLCKGGPSSHDTWTILYQSHFLLTHSLKAILHHP